jgi:nucleotide-binding universal stress UspA family protein
MLAAQRFQAGGLHSVDVDLAKCRNPGRKEPRSSAAWSVLTVPPRARKTSVLPFKRILCPIDFGDTSKAALELAASLASEGDADLTILHVLEPGADADPLPSRSFTVPEYHQFRHEEACAQLKALVDDEMREWCRPTTRIVRGKPYREILGVATEDGADLIDGRARTQRSGSGAVRIDNQSSRASRNLSGVDVASVRGGGWPR